MGFLRHLGQDVEAQNVDHALALIIWTAFRRDHSLRWGQNLEPDSTMTIGKLNAFIAYVTILVSGLRSLGFWSGRSTRL